MTGAVLFGLLIGVWCGSCLSSMVMRRVCASVMQGLVACLWKICSHLNSQSCLCCEAVRPIETRQGDSRALLEVLTGMDKAHSCKLFSNECTLITINECTTRLIMSHESFLFICTERN